MFGERRLLPLVENNGTGLCSAAGPEEGGCQDVATVKSAMRVSATTARMRGDGLARSARLVHSLSRVIARLPGGLVAAVWPLPGEPDLRPLLHDLHARGRSVLLPETTPRGQALLFRRWTPACTMLPGRFGTHAPDGQLATPDVVLVPFLAFDRRGRRLGYGGGYYDRTLAGLPHGLSVGFGYASQEVEAVPIEPHDRPLDLIVTERGTVWRGPRTQYAGDQTQVREDGV